MKRSYWPFSRRSAFIASAVLVPVSIFGFLWLSDQEIGNFEFSPWILIVALVIGLLPIIAEILSDVDSVEAGGVRVAFAAVQEVVASTSDIETRSLLTHNLGDTPGQVADSASSTVIDTLGAAVGNEVVEISLLEGEA